MLVYSMKIVAKKMTQCVNFFVVIGGMDAKITVLDPICAKTLILHTTDGD